MVTLSRWREAQEVEHPFWAGIAQDTPGLLRILADNAARAQRLNGLLGRMPETCLEVGMGPFGFGVVAFLSGIPFRVGVDPCEPIPLEPGRLLHGYVRDLQRSIHYVVGWGENIPLRSSSMDLVVCCNVIDHAFKPPVILAEIHRVLRPAGHLFLDVDTFSLLGLAKWHAWTKYRHRDEILVRAHPYRLIEPAVSRMLRRCGFQILKSFGHGWLSFCFGRSRIATYLALKTAGLT